jgi:predicted short-subunit dehydrogenase-like oxidoreductase (DUF2520 family)
MKPTLSIIGAGKVGRVLAQLFHRHQIFSIQDVQNRTAASGAAAVEFIGAGNFVTEFSELIPADIFMISVPDDQIKSCANQLKEHDLVTPDTIVFHCSGVLDSSELEFDSPTASLHPMRSFADSKFVADNFASTICTMEGDDKATMQLALACHEIGAHIVTINRGAKTLYHAGAVFASNYLVTLMDTALQTLEAAGISPEAAQKMVRPLAQETFNNIFNLGTQQALTGPIARGDELTVTRHENALKAWDNEQASLYLALAKSTRAMKVRGQPKT